ncbi:hypothetical protein Nepgr_023238 [Nepenthes gracilis]|uniref:Uncharacterized protein n=1 Tax=Nepenthes gracilis TaxID=150966 RepID=A0AAD3T3Z3_NEPGR|nr:hypothetical protein Nepgr_023238 [Nepenthes gracilis]
MQRNALVIVDSVSSPRFLKPSMGVDSVLALSPKDALDVIGKPGHVEAAPLLVDSGSRPARLKSVEVPVRTPSSWSAIVQNRVSFLRTPVSSNCSPRLSNRSVSDVFSNHAQEEANQVITPPFEQDGTWKHAKSRRHRKSKSKNSKGSLGKCISWNTS